LQGFAAAAYPPVAITYLAERGTVKQRAWGMAWISTAFLMAGLLGQIYGAYVGKLMHFGLALLPLCAIYLGTATMLWRTSETQAAPATHLAGWSSVGRALVQVVGNPQLRRAYVPALVLLMCFVAFYIGLDARMGLAFQQSGFNQLNIREIALPGFLAPLAVAVLLPRFGPQRIASAGLGIATAGLLCAAVVTEPMLVLLASVLFVTGIGITVPGLIARVASTTARSHYRGMAIAFYTFTLFVGASLDSGQFFGLLAAVMAVATAISWSSPSSALPRTSS
jgi:MFS family permease